jgi:hypothetical protein
MAMIELIFAIVIIAISILTIPTVVAVAGNASNVLLNQENVVFELVRVANDKFQSRWDGEYHNMNSNPLRLANPSVGDLNCSAAGGTSRVGYTGAMYLTCDDNVTKFPTAIPVLGDGNVSRGIEQLNGGTEKIRIAGTSYDISASYHVRYVDSTLNGPTNNDNNVSAIWTLGSVDNPNPDGSVNVPTNLKRIVVVFSEATSGTRAVLTFFKSNKGN